MPTYLTLGQSVCAKRIFLSAGSEIFHAAWSWARRRHARKGGKWIRKKYFRSHGNRNWTFFAKVKTQNAPPIILDLFEAGKVKIRRHAKVKAEATPYDPAFQDYFIQQNAHMRFKRIENNRGK